MELLNAFLTSQGLGNTLQSIIVVILVFILFRKGITNHIIQSAGLATKEDMAVLRKEWKADIQSIKDNDLQHINYDILSLRKDMEYLHKDMEYLRKEIQSMKDNDFFHIAMAILLHCRETVKNKESFERIKDMLMETVPDAKKPQMQAINFPDDN
jgi:uncharacterized protein YjaZ